MQQTYWMDGETRGQQANATRWNSQLKMVRSLLSIYKDKMDSLDTPYLLDRRKHSILQDTVEILTPFEKATDALQSEKSVTASLIIPLIDGLRDHMNSMVEKHNSKFTTSLHAAFERRMSQYETMDSFQTAPALDPRFKLTIFSSDRVPLSNVSYELY